MTTQMFILTIISSSHSIFTILLKTIFTRFTFLAGIHHTSNSNKITFLKVFYVCANFYHTTNDFMAWYYGIFTITPIISNLMYIAMTNSTIIDFDLHIICKNVPAFDLHHIKICIIRLCAVSFYIFHFFLLLKVTQFITTTYDVLNRFNYS